MAESLGVHPTELHLAAEKIEGHSSDFLTTHESACSQAGEAVLGSGLAGAALTEMLGAWESDGTRFGERHVTHADHHRAAANTYVSTDTGGADGIDAAASAL